MSNLSNLSITKTFNGDVAASNKVNAADLDTQLGNIASSLNAHKAAIDAITDGSNNLAPQSVGFTQLRPEVATALGSGSVSGTGWQPKVDVACATTANISLIGEQTIDGVLTSASRVLVKNQSTSSQNGIYVSSSGIWSRAYDADTGEELVYATVRVGGGTTQNAQQWICTNGTAPTLGDTAIVWVQGGFTASDAMQPVVGSATTALARAAMGPWDDALVTSTNGYVARSLSSRFATMPSTADFDCGPWRSAASNTTQLTACIAWALANGHRDIFVPVAFTVDESGGVIRQKSLVFFHGQQISGLYRRASITEGVASNVRVSRRITDAALAAFSRASAPVVVMMGDSISGYTVSGCQPEDSMWGAICQEVSRVNPGKTCTFYNRGIGGQVWAHANNLPNSFPWWYTNQSKQWLDYVHDLNPDLLFLAFGMNDSNGFDASQMHAVIDKILLWTKVPSIVIVTNPVPSIATTYGGGSGFGDKTSQEGRDYVANYERCVAEFYGYGLLDINRQFNLIRDGRDITNCYGTMLALQSGAYAVGTECHEYAFEGGISSWTNGKAIRCTVSANGSDYVDITKNGTTLSIYAQSSGRIPYYTNTYTLPYANIGSIGIRITSTRCVVTVEGETEVFRFNLLRHGGLFTPRISWNDNQTSGPFATYTLSQSTPEPVNQSLTDEDIFGNPENPSAGNVLPYGGNGVNHYSSLGISHIVRPVVESAGLHQRTHCGSTGTILQGSGTIVLANNFSAVRNGSVVTMAGACAISGSASTTLLFTLPLGFRPSADRWIAVPKSTAGGWSHTQIKVGTDGTVTLYDTAPIFVIDVSVSFQI